VKKILNRKTLQKKKKKSSHLVQAAALQNRQMLKLQELARPATKKKNWEKNFEQRRVFLKAGASECRVAPEILTERTSERLHSAEKRLAVKPRTALWTFSIWALCFRPENCAIKSAG